MSGAVLVAVRIRIDATPRQTAELEIRQRNADQKSNNGFATDPYSARPFAGISYGSGLRARSIPPGGARATFRTPAARPGVRACRLFATSPELIAVFLAGDTSHLFLVCANYGHCFTQYSQVGSDISLPWSIRLIAGAWSRCPASNAAHTAHRPARNLQMPLFSTRAGAHQKDNRSHLSPATHLGNRNCVPNQKHLDS